MSSPILLAINLLERTHPDKDSETLKRIVTQAREEYYQIVADNRDLASQLDARFSVDDALGRV